MPPSIKIVAEYAKSNRSFCKKCSKTIDSKSLRLGLVSRDSRGFDMTKWHHLGCFSFGSESLPSAEEIKGFDSLKSSDQEALQKLVETRDKTQDEVDKPDRDGDGDGDEDEDEEKESEGRNIKKAKLSISKGENLDVTFLVSDVKNKYKDATLSPKWKAFQTVIFLERDEGLHDSSKIAAFDFDGCLANTSVRRMLHLLEALHKFGSLTTRVDALIAGLSLPMNQTLSAGKIRDKLLWTQKLVA